MDLGIKEKVALITAAGRGLGRSIALSFANEGANVIAVSRGEKSLAELKDTAAGDITPLALDLLENGAIATLIDFMAQQRCKPNIVVHNLGGSLGIKDPLVQLSEWERVWRLNVGVSTAINNLCAEHMKSKGWGRIVHISSASAHTLSGNPAYVSAKAALNGYIVPIARELAPKGVVVAGVSPGPLYGEGRYYSELQDKAAPEWKEFCEHHLPIGRLASPEEIAPAVMFLCSQHASYAGGSIVRLDDGII